MTLFTVSLHSKALHKHTELHVLMPDLATRERPAKVLWALHGMSEDHNGWLRKSMVELLAEKYGVCVVIPNADLSFYVDMAYGADYFTYLSAELPAYLKRYFPISGRKEDNYIIGDSMGGYGAFYIAMNCPEKYNTAISLSGPMRIDWINRILSSADLADVFASRDSARIEKSASEFAVKYRLPESLIYSLWEYADMCTTRTFKAMFGLDADLANTRYDIFYLATKLQEKNSDLKLWAFCGEQDYHYISNIKFRDAVCDTKLDYNLVTGSGAHNWEYWNNKIPYVMQNLFEK